MADVTANSNSLEYLIPTGKQDLAVQQLTGIFGDAISCKVPGAPCGTGNSFSGELLANLFGVYNGAIFIFVTIMLIFIGLFAFTKTALDGEFMGKSWNTTFTSLRLIAGVAFLLPMPNSYSTIQNFALYVGLWGSGIANEATVAISDTYLKRVQTSMLSREPGATSVEDDLRSILMMHMCANYMNTKYAPYSQLTFTSKVDKNNDITRTSYFYAEQGTQNQKGSQPCGTFSIDTYPEREAEGITDSSYIYSGNGNNPSGWKPAMWSDPLSTEVRSELWKLSQTIVKQVRDAKTSILIENLQPVERAGVLAGLSQSLVNLYIASQVQVNEDGSIKQSGALTSDSGTVLSSEQAKMLVAQYSIIAAKSQEKLTQAVAAAQASMFKSTGADGSSNILAKAKTALTEGGWMNTAATYRMMLDLVSINFSPTTKPYTLTPPNEQELMSNSEYGATSMGQQMTYMRTLVNNMLDDPEAVKQINIAAGGPASVGSSAPPKLTDGLIKKIATEGLSSQEVSKVIYGGMASDFRNWIIKSMALNDQVDPLFQVKSLGDKIIAVVETMHVVEMGARVAIASSSAIQQAASGNILGKIADGVTGGVSFWGGVIDGVKYILEGILGSMKALSLALLAIGYAFTTWLPALPFISFLMAQLGWLFGLVMTLFALPIWAVMHATPTQGDSFIGSERQGYLFLVSLSFRPVISVAALAISYVIAPPIIKLINVTMIPMFYIANSSMSVFTVLLITMFGLILYFSVIKGVLVMIYTIPQSFPDEVMKIINAGIGDLGQSTAMQTIGGGAAGAAMAIQQTQGLSQSGEKHLEGTLKRKSDNAAKAAKEASDKQKATQGEPDTKDVSISGGVHRVN